MVSDCSSLSRTSSSTPPTAAYADQAGWSRTSLARAGEYIQGNRLVVCAPLSRKEKLLARPDLLLVDLKGADRSAVDVALLLTRGAPARFPVSGLKEWAAKLLAELADGRRGRRRLRRGR